MKINQFLKAFSLLFLLVTTSPLYAQITFASNFDIIPTEGYRSGVANAIADVNGDGRDDLVRITSKNVLEVNFGSGNTTELKLSQFEASLPSEAWNITVGNLDNKGPNEIALGTVYKGGYIFKYNEVDQSLELIQSTARDFYSQGSNFVDINNDGHLDWFICDDEAENEIFLNDGQGNLLESDDYIDMSTKVESDNSGNYASDWVDIDSDGDLDFYISKCRSGAKEATDPRRINQLFINDGNNNFTEKAEEFNIAFGAQTWATNFGDLDNDGDLDAIIINHGDSWNLLENIDNKTFVDRPDLINNLHGFAIQCILRDFDNNGYLDILVTGSSDYLWFNYGDMNFEIERRPFKYANATNFAVGDITHDGFIDAYVAHTKGYNDPGLQDDILYENGGNDNNWVGLRLNGKISNMCGIGARLRAYTPTLGWQIRDVRSGESYGIMNSLNSIFGLGDEDKIEHLEVTWPSGHVDNFYDVEAGQYYTVTEGICISKDEELTARNNGILCKDKRLKLEGKQDMLNVWSTGEEFSSIEVVNDGIYSMNATDAQGCITKAPAINIRNIKEVSEANIIEASNDANCFSTTLNINSVLAKSYEWDTGVKNMSITADETKVYEVTVTDHCDTEFKVSREVVVVDPTPKNVIGDTVIAGASAQLVASGTNLKWFNHLDDHRVIETGNTLDIDEVEEDMTFYVQGENTHSFESEYCGEIEWKGTDRYGDVDLNGGMYFEVHEDIILESVEVYTDTIGVRTFQILDDEREVIFAKDIDLAIGKNIIDLDVFLPPGFRYFLTTEVNKNFQTYGFYGPRLERSNTETKYPYRNSDLLWLTGSAFGAQYIHYFYNWKFKQTDLTCISEKMPVPVVLDISSSTEEELPKNFSIYPNPTNGIVTIENQDAARTFNLQIFNIQGGKVFSMMNIKDSSQNVDISTFPAGIYTIHFTSVEGTNDIKRLVKVD